MENKEIIISMSESEYNRLKNIESAYNSKEKIVFQLGYAHTSTGGFSNQLHIIGSDDATNLLLAEIEALRFQIKREREQSCLPKRKRNPFYFWDSEVKLK